MVQTTITLDEHQKAEFAEFLKAKKERLLKELDNLQVTMAKLYSEEPEPEVEVKNKFHLIEPIYRTKQKLKLFDTEHLSDGQLNKFGVTSGVRDTVGWKYKIDAVLEKSTLPLTGSQILKEIIELYPEFARHVSARKSISSVLSTNSGTNGRYMCTTNDGLNMYSMNPRFKEEKHPV